MRCFVTVGTTNFDALIEMIDTDRCLKALKAKGFDKVVVQIGRTGTYKPQMLEVDNSLVDNSLILNVNASLSHT